MSKRKYYDTKPKALNARKPGLQRIYYDADKRKYYLVDIPKRPFWRLNV